MSIKLSKEQSKKGDLLLKLLCDSENSFSVEQVEKVFDSNSEFRFVCNILENKKLINSFVQVGDELGGVKYSKTELTCGFLENGGLIKEYRNSKKHFSTYQIVYLSGFFIFGLFGVYKMFFPSVSISDFQTLENDFHNTKNQLDSLIQKNKTYKTTKIELLNDTLQTKNFGGLKVD